MANVGRSQMAEAFFAHMAPRHHATSAGFLVLPEREGRPISEVTDKVIQSMQEEGIDMSAKVQNKITPAMVEEADKVIVLAPEAALPDFLEYSPKLEIWNVSDAGGTDQAFHHHTRDLIKEKVRNLIQRIDS